MFVREAAFANHFWQQRMKNLLPIYCSDFISFNFGHRGIVPTPFLVFQCANQFAQKKSGSCHSKVSKFVRCNCNCESAILLNHHNFECIPSNNNIWLLILTSLTDRSLRESVCVCWSRRPNLRLGIMILRLINHFGYL